MPALIGGVFDRLSYAAGACRLRRARVCSLASDTRTGTQLVGVLRTADWLSSLPRRSGSAASRLAFLVWPIAPSLRRTAFVRLHGCHRPRRVMVIAGAYRARAAVGLSILWETQYGPSSLKSRWSRSRCGAPCIIVVRPRLEAGDGRRGRVSWERLRSLPPSSSRRRSSQPVAAAGRRDDRDDRPLLAEPRGASRSRPCAHGEPPCALALALVSLPRTPSSRSSGPVRREPRAARRRGHMLSDNVALLLPSSRLGSPRSPPRLSGRSAVLATSRTASCSSRCDLDLRGGGMRSRSRQCSAVDVAIALLGIVVNVAAVSSLAHAPQPNVEAAFRHVRGSPDPSAAVAAVVTLATGWAEADPL